VSRADYQQLQDVIDDADFPELDLALRRGRHVDRDDTSWYELLTSAQDHVESLYRRYGCELVHKPDGYFYLLPTGDKLSRRQLSPTDMLVGQALALAYLDPATVERGGRVTTEDVIAQLVAVLGSDALIAAFNPKRKRHDERVAQKAVRTGVGQAVRRLSQLGFCDLGDGDQLRLRAALLRFAEPVRGLSAPAEALARLVAEGEVALATEPIAGPDAGEPDDASDAADEGAAEPAADDDDDDDAAAADPDDDPFVDDERDEEPGA
jgi:chromosome partition protein MukE